MAAMSEHNPFVVVDVADRSAEANAALREPGGIRRLTFTVLLPLVYLGSAVFAIAWRNLGYRGTGNFTTLTSIPLYLTLCCLRLRNAGYRPAWLLAVFLPFLTPFILLGLFAAPEGYADHGQFDTAGKVVIGLAILGFVLLVTMSLLAGLTKF